MKKVIKDKYYVYKAIGINGEILYVGKGINDRYKHCLYGGSQSKDLNRYYFQNGEDGSITVEIVKYFNNGNDALEYEKEFIQTIKPLFNINENPDKIKKKPHNPRQGKCVATLLSEGFTVDYSRVMRQYIKAIESGDTKLVEAIEVKSEIHKHHLEVIGASKIKALYFHKTKVTRAFELALKSSLESVSIASSLNFKLGGRYTTEDVVKQLSIAYNKCGLDVKAKGVDIKNYFSVKDVYVMCKEDGKRKRGYEIVSVI